MEKSQSEIVVAEFISASVRDKTRPYGINHAVSRGETEPALVPGHNGAARYEAGFKCLNNKLENPKLKRSTSAKG